MGHVDGLAVSLSSDVFELPPTCVAYLKNTTPNL